MDEEFKVRLSHIARLKKKKVPLKGGEIAKSIKCLSGHREGLISILRAHVQMEEDRGDGEEEGEEDGEEGGGEKEKEVVMQDYDHSAGKVEDGWGSLVSQPFLVREPQVPARFPVSENKMDRF